MSTSLLVSFIGAVLLVTGIAGLRDRRTPSTNRISLIEYTLWRVGGVEPVPEQPWERKLDRLLCWIGVFVGLLLILGGLASL